MDFGTERRRRVFRVGGVLLASAGLFYFGTGLAPIAALTWLAPLPVLVLASRVSARAAVSVAFFAYLLGTANCWAFQWHSHDEAMFPIGIIINVGMSLTFTLAVWVFRLVANRGLALLAPVAAAAAWTGTLYLVSVSNPWGLMGTFANDQGDLPVVLQTASVAGMWGVDFLVMFAPCAVAAALAPHVSTAARRRTIASAVIILAVTFGGGAMRLSATKDATQRVAAIAPNHYAWAPAVSRDLVAGYIGQINALPIGTKTVVLPEAAFGSDETSPALLVLPMRQVAKARGIDIVVGLVRSDGSARYDMALAFPADGGEPTHYLKHHDRVSPQGHELTFTSAHHAAVGIEICADVDFPDPSRQYALAGSRLLALPASDEDANGWQHSRTALLRGVENGASIIWSGQRGRLAIADGWGVVVAEAHTGGPGEFTAITADVPVGPGTTPYSRFGDWFAWLCIAGAIVAVLTASRRDRLLVPGSASRPAAGEGSQDRSQRDSTSRTPTKMTSTTIEGAVTMDI